MKNIILSFTFLVGCSFDTGDLADQGLGGEAVPFMKVGGKDGFVDLVNPYPLCSLCDPQKDAGGSVTLPEACHEVNACTNQVGGITIHPFQKTFLLDVYITSAARPFFASVQILDERGGWFGGPIPERGHFPLSGEKLHSYYRELDVGRGDSRRVLVIGRLDARAWWGVKRFTLDDSKIKVVDIVLEEREFLDEDTDGIPDEIDDCPGEDDSEGCHP